MQAVKYMSLVFRGAIEEYDATGVRPSVFLDKSGDLQIYLCDPILDDPEMGESVPDMELEVNGGQFAGSIGDRFNVTYNKVRSEVGSEQLPI
ncbi:hypothetical protein LI82_04540 [Methanococcoides methylutens]|uniref:Uncharacterized protein n=1 Tax=Methanococcoides methylutens TaxID=2226 RepID=A0A099T322_METMT|nr:hypothetical protein [Methanococcoides methylutens]KGK99289.1 hypothetical protein LI82_04540 [Methanococcoides methylutens]